MQFPSFRDAVYFPAAKIYPTDRCIMAFCAWAIPLWITPNHITLLRMIATPPTFLLLALEQYDVGIPLFLFVAFTDALDGALARTRNQITQWGRIFDPVADKLLIIPIVLLLVVANLNIFLAGAIVSTELLIIALALLWRKEGRLIQANLWGKIKMILQVGGVTLLLVALWLGVPAVLPVASFLLEASLVCAFVSIIRHGI